MAEDCSPLIDAAFLQTVTGVDVSNSTTVDDLIVIVSSLIGEELGGCVAPETASMKLRVVCAQYTAYVMNNGSTGGAAPLRAEQIGDYRVEYQRTSEDRFDLQVLRDMLATMNSGSAYSVSTLGDTVQGYIPRVDYWDPNYIDTVDGKRTVGYPGVGPL